jgi:hypothetical protein
MKVCSKCKNKLPLENFYYQKDGKFERTSRCKPCVQISNKKWALENPNTLQKYHRQVRQDNKEKYLEATRQWRKRNLAYDAKRQRERRARVINAIPKWINNKNVSIIYANAEKLGLEVDHIVPLTSPKVCGLHWEGNLQLLTPTENRSKGNRYWEDMP